MIAPIFHKVGHADHDRGNVLCRIVHAFDLISGAFGNQTKLIDVIHEGLRHGVDLLGRNESLLVLVPIFAHPIFFSTFFHSVFNLAHPPSILSAL